MEQYKKEFIEFMVDSEVLKFGDFTLKSGRKSPFFMNAGAYVTGTQLRKLGEYYAKAFMITMDLILMYCLGLLIKEFLWQWPHLWQSVNFTAKMFGTAPTAKKSKTTEIQEFCSAPI